MDTDQRTLPYDYRQATGLRKLTPRMLETIEVAETHSFATEMKPGQALAAFKAAAPYLGFRPSVVHAVDLLFRFTDPLDWEPSSRPIVWPSAALQQQEMGLGASQVKNLNRHLVELGLVVMRDSPNGKRYGRRGPDRRIVEAYGFDLSPIASRFAEFHAVAQAGREERTRLLTLRRRATIARNSIRQLMETASEQNIAGAEWDAYRSTSAYLSSRVTRKTSGDMEVAVATLEKLQGEMRHFLKVAFERRSDLEDASGQNYVDNNPKQPENWPHITATNQLINLKTVAAPEKRSFTQNPVTLPNQAAETYPQGPAMSSSKLTPNTPTVRSDVACQLRLTPSELTKLAPRLTPYLRHGVAKWPDVVDAADWLREEMGIPQFVWGDACLALGREQAAVAVAIVSAKPSTHFHHSAGAYFHGMVSRAKAGELHLTRTIWGLRNRRQSESIVNRRR